jgi:hypothetical protein
MCRISTPRSTGSARRSFGAGSSSSTSSAGTVWTSERPTGTTAGFALSPRPLARAARAAVAVGAVALGASQLVQGPLTVLQARSLYVRDFTQEYTLARATLAGDDPYATVSELTERYVGASFALISREFISAAPPPVPTADTGEIGNHPTPHPPPVALFALPLAFLSFQTASAVWCAFELLCLAATLWLLARTDRVRVGPIAIAAATVPASCPTPPRITTMNASTM